ncbi:MAG: LacI family DNA-binding transcriptional regulator [Pseudomonadota bacterium]
MTGRVTSFEVAKRAGVSRSAVSRVFTPGASVSEKTARKVREAATALGYRPNVLARSLLTGKSRIIGLVVGYLDNHFYPVVLEKLSNALQAEGYHVMIFMAADLDRSVRRVTEELLDYQVDGLIMASISMTSNMVKWAEELGVPVVLFNRRDMARAATSVVSDNLAGGRLAAAHLMAAGHRRIAYVAGSAVASTQRDREEGFVKALGDAGRSLWRRVDGGFDADQTRAAVRSLLDQPERPDAVFAANDLMAFVLMDVARYESGLNIPDDLAVIGFDDVPAASWPSYDLTTVRQDAGAMVAEAVSLVLSPRKGPVQAVLPVELIKRASTL